MLDELEELLTTELADRASNLPPPTVRLDEVRRRSRQRATRRRFVVGALSALGISTIAATGIVVVAASFDSAEPSSIVAGPTLATVRADASGELSRNAPDDPTTGSPAAEHAADDTVTDDTVTDDTVTDDTVTDDTVTDDATGGRPTRDGANDSPEATATTGIAAEEAPTEPTVASSASTAPTSAGTGGDDPTTGSATTTGERSASSTRLPLASEPGLGVAAVAVPPLPTSGPSWEAVLADASVWQQWEDARSCARRIDPAAGYVGEPICFDFVYPTGDWAIVEGPDDHTVAWYGLNPVGEKRTVDLVLSDGSIVAGVVDGERWVVEVDYRVVSPALRPAEIRLTTDAADHVLPLPPLVAAAPGSILTFTAALIPG